MTEDELFDLEDYLDGFVDGVDPLTGQGSEILNGLDKGFEQGDGDEGSVEFTAGSSSPEQQTLEDIFKQFGADGWQKEHEESGAYKVDFVKGEMNSEIFLCAIDFLSKRKLLSMGFGFSNFARIATGETSFIIG